MYSSQYLDIAKRKGHFCTDQILIAKAADSTPNYVLNEIFSPPCSLITSCSLNRYYRVIKARIYLDN